MTVISFQNPGVIDTRCITTIGISVKESENPIGFFGTGLKYAIAIILRNRGGISIWRGTEELKFGLNNTTIRGEAASVVTMNGAELSFTSHLGERWEIWQAYRELWCNTKDEGGDVHWGAISPEIGKTTIQVMLQEFGECFKNTNKYILQSAPISKTPSCEFHRTAPSCTVFYNSINVGAAYDKPHLFTPNILCKLELTEDRTLKNIYAARRAIAEGVLQCDDGCFVEQWLTAPEGYAEHEADLDWPIVPSKAFLAAAARISADSSRTINQGAIAILSKHGCFVNIIEAVLLEHEEAILVDAIAFCKALTYTVDEYKIVVVEALGPCIVGRADRGLRQIYIARSAIQKGVAYLASTLIEEWCHIKHGHNDCDRGMQNWLFDQLARLGQAYLYERRKTIQPAQTGDQK